MIGRRILMVAFHFPPLKASSGLQRTLTFSRYLSEDHNWRPTVLSAHPRAYATTSEEQINSIGDDVRVVRVLAFDAARHFAIAGRYPNWIALPDRWANWWLAGVLSGLKIIRTERPDVIWSTYPIATAHMIGHTLSRLSGIPWVADFRDSMTEDGYPAIESQWKSYRKIEEKTVRRSSAIVFTAPGARDMYRERYSTIPESHWRVIENGFDETEFPTTVANESCSDERTQLLHSGILYRDERNPEAFFSALARLKKNKEISSRSLRVTLRGTGDDEHYENRTRYYDIQDIVEILPAIGYAEALKEMTLAGGLLIFQAANCNHQIPAKLYEYFHAKRPILAMTDPLGDTARTAMAADNAFVVDLEDEQDIAIGLRRLLREAANPTLAAIDSSTYSRRARAAELASLLDEIA